MLVSEAVINPQTAGPKFQLIRQQMAGAVTTFFSAAASDAAGAVKKKLSQTNKVSAADLALIAALAKAAYEAIQWDSLFTYLLGDLAATAKAAVDEGVQQVEVTAAEKAALESAAEDYAYVRAAEMIGKQFVAGELVDYSSAKWVIAEVTKDDLYDLIESAVTDGLNNEEIYQAVFSAKTFGKVRASLIAKNETAMAQVNSGIEVWKKSGSIPLVDVMLGPAHEVTDECDAAAKGSPYPITNVPFIPMHPYCCCWLKARAA